MNRTVLFSTARCSASLVVLLVLNGCPMGGFYAPLDTGATTPAAATTDSDAGVATAGDTGKNTGSVGTEPGDDSGTATDLDSGTTSGGTDSTQAADSDTAPDTGTDTNPDSGGSGYDPDAYDNDGDGFSEDEGDCDDNRSDVSPILIEICDGRDNDCDGQIDDGGVCPVDADGDGFTTGADCDDSNAAINPAAIETCNGVDDDCDGLTDEGNACKADPDTGTVTVTDTGSAPTDTGVTTTVATDSGGSDSAATPNPDTGGATDSAPKEDTAASTAKDTGTDTGTTTTTTPPCTGCVVRGWAPGFDISSYSPIAGYGAGPACALSELNWALVATSNDSKTVSWQVNVNDGDIVHESALVSSVYECMANALVGANTAKYYKTDGSSCDIDLAALTVKSGGCEIQYKASCPTSASTCPAF